MDRSRKADEKMGEHTKKRCRINKVCKGNRAMYWYQVVDFIPTFVPIIIPRPNKYSYPCCSACAEAILINNENTVSGSDADPG